MKSQQPGLEEHALDRGGVADAQQARHHGAVGARARAGGREPQPPAAPQPAEDGELQR